MTPKKRAATKRKASTAPRAKKAAVPRPRTPGRDAPYDGPTGFAASEPATLRNPLPGVKQRKATRRSTSAPKAALVAAPPASDVKE